MRVSTLSLLLAIASSAVGAEVPPRSPSPERAKSKRAKTDDSAESARKADAEGGVGKDLLEGGDFEKGSTDRPAGWALPDGLTTSWVAAPGRKGKCMKIDTDVLSTQFREREDALARAAEAKRPPPPAPARLPTREPKYDTVAGLDGVHYRADPIAFDARKAYRLEVDVLASVTSAPKVWVKVYAKRKSSGGERERVVWKKSLNCDGAGPEWKTFRMVFPTSTRFPEGSETLRVELYPFWPPAVYHFDRVRLVEIGEREAREATAEEAERRRGGKAEAEAQSAPQGEVRAPPDPEAGQGSSGAPPGASREAKRDPGVPRQ